MPSQAFAQFQTANREAALLRETARKAALPRGSVERRVQMHACLAGHVAAWEAYLEAAAMESLSAASDPLDRRLTAIQDLHRRTVENSVRKFNTPNWQNSRTLVLTTIGYDPINDWNWSARGFNSVTIRVFWDEIIGLRHSFAHGFHLRSHSWLCHAAGCADLQSSCLVLVGAFFTHLVRITDKEVGAHLRATYGPQFGWR